MKLQIVYTTEMVAEVDFDPETDDIQDAVCDIDIPEGGKSKSRYIANTFKVLSAMTTDGQPICASTGKILD